MGFQGGTDRQTFKHTDIVIYWKNWSRRRFFEKALWKDLFFVLLPWAKADKNRKLLPKTHYFLYFSWIKKKSRENCSVNSTINCTSLCSKVWRSKENIKQLLSNLHIFVYFLSFFYIYMGFAYDATADGVVRKVCRRHHCWLCCMTPQSCRHKYYYLGGGRTR